MASKASRSRAAAAPLRHALHAQASLLRPARQLRQSKAPVASDAYVVNLLKNQYRTPDKTAAAGSVNTQASAISRSVEVCSPLLFAAIVPATPDESTFVVL